MRAAAQTVMIVAVALGASLDARAQTALSPPPHPENAAVLRVWSPEYPSFSRNYTLVRGPAIRAHAARLLAERPEALETFEMLLYAERPADAMAVLGRLIERRPQDIARAFDLVAQQAYAIRGETVDMRSLWAAARERLRDMRGEPATEALLSLLKAETSVAPQTGRDQYFTRLETFVRDHAGRNAALLAEVDTIGAGNDTFLRVERYESFARAHPGTEAAARALFRAAVDLGRNTGGRVQDPTESFLRVFAIVRELRSGRYPPCEWVSRATELGLGLFASKPIYAPGSAERLLAAYHQFVATHFTEPEIDSPETGMGYTIVTRMGDLFELFGDRRGGVERTLTALEKVHAARAKFLRAHYYAKIAADTSGTERPALLQRARDLLVELAAREGSGLYGRKAVALHGSIEFDAGQYEAARRLFDSYVRAFPQTEWSWVAALRIGRAEEALGNLDAAASAYRLAAENYAAVPVARALGHAYAARALETLGRFSEAASELAQALEGWPERSPSLWLDERLVPSGQPRPDVSRVARVDVAARVEQLRVVALPGGDLVAQGRLLIERGEYAAARRPLETAVATISDPIAVGEARFLLHRARIEQALARVDIARASTAADEIAAHAEFDAIGRDPYGFGVAAAQIAKATLLMRQGARVQADAAMLAALSGWRDGSALLPAAPGELPDEVARDVAEIRAVLFRPRGDGAMAAERWFDKWPASSRFVVVNADVFVALPGAEANRVTVRQSFPAVDNVLLLTTPQLELLRRILTRLAGENAGSPRTSALFDFWNGFFPMSRAMIGAAVLETMPSMSRITFTNADRTAASVAVGIALEGATFNLVKDGAGWRLVSITNRWIA
jgi:tetratricopeptide (TPR) repeat protein